MTERYDVRCKKLPNYCYSCGIIGHSSIVLAKYDDQNRSNTERRGFNVKTPFNKKGKTTSASQQQSSLFRVFTDHGETYNKMGSPDGLQGIFILVEP
jgi:hypothetical protein